MWSILNREGYEDDKQYPNKEYINEKKHEAGSSKLEFEKIIKSVAERLMKFIECRRANIKIKNNNLFSHMGYFVNQIYDCENGIFWNYL